MVASSDIEYKKTKLIKQGIKDIDDQFKSLSNWISKKYKVIVLDIQEEYMTHNNKLRLAVHVERYHEAMKFHEGNVWHGNFDLEKQNLIATKYIEIGNLTKIPIPKLDGILEKRNPKMEDIFVSFSAFVPVAKEETIQLIPEEKFNQLFNQLNSEKVWKIDRCFGVIILFVFFDRQIEDFKKSEKFQNLENQYFQLLKEYDEFDYWKRESFTIGIDSKENLDHNYEGNLNYYYR